MTTTGTAVHIPDMLAAIRDGTVPGKLSDDRTAFEFPVLTYAVRKATNLWAIRVRLMSIPDTAAGGTAVGEYVEITDEMLVPGALIAGHRAEITVEAGQAGGKVRDTVPTYVSEGKNLGKKNATNCLTQALRDALGLYNKQKKKANLVGPDDVDATANAAKIAEGEAAGVPGPPKAAKAAKATDERPPPMLVKKIGETRAATLTAADFKAGVTAQRKLNGVRFVAYRPPNSNDIVCYSRTGTLYPAPQYLVDELRGMFDSNISAAAAPPDLYLDGELYKHGASLNRITGQARRGKGKADEALLEYNIFDVFFPGAKAAGLDMPSRERQAHLDAFFAASKMALFEHPHISRVENYPVRSREELDELGQRFLAEGYEGVIARRDGAGYEYSYSNHHSANVVKIKPKHDDEYLVVGYTQGDRGKDVGAVVWICEVPEAAAVDPADRTFNVVPNMSLEERHDLFQCLGQVVETSEDGTPVTHFDRYIRGKPLTVKYAELSAKTGKPLQAKAIAFRTYEAGPDADPVRQLMLQCAGAGTGGGASLTEVEDDLQSEASAA